jgi:hypothetical protein
MTTRPASSRARQVASALGLALVATAAALAALLARAPTPAAAAEPSSSSAADAGDGATLPSSPSRKEGSATPTPTPTDAFPDEPATTPASDGSGSGMPVWWALVGSAVALVAVTGAYAVGRGRATPAPASPAPPLPVAPPRPVPADGPVDRIVDGLIAAHDLTSEPAVRASLEQTLRGVGVVPLAPAPGAAFDATAHEAVGVRPAPGPADVGTVAAVVRVGWATGARLLRPAQVLVHRQS